MGFMSEFKEFAVKGNVVDLAVGFILGAAFGKIVTSLVNDIIMPPIGMALGGVNFADMFVSLDGKSYTSLEVAQAAGAPVIAYGSFINVIIEFLIIALALFFMIKTINSLKRKEEAAPPAPPNTKDCPYCAETIPKAAIRCPHCTSDLSGK
ncbi:MAG: large conductance mechanosensitive channel protein MscL [Methanotrichaceae archaeon]|nr:large conductance mechanosensitive channel protein MscL [Methanotrichaceae archaeon]